MTDDLARLRDDLATVRVAAGLDPTWERGALRTHALLALAGVLALAWAVIPHGLRPVLGLFAFAVPVFDWWWRMRPGGREPAPDQEWREALAVLWYVLPLTLLALWSKAVGLSAVVTAGLIVFMLGFVLYGSAITERRLRPLLGWSVAFMAGGLFAPLGILPFLPVLAAAIAIGATLSGVWIAADQRRAG